MPNQVFFEHYIPSEVLLTKREVLDLLDVLYRGTDTFHIFGVMRSDRQRRPTLGLHVTSDFFGGHEIYLAPQKIHDCFYRGLPTGGNRKAPNVRLAVGMVLAHEIQHANQTILHENHPASFYGKRRSRYRTRPCEREARQFADDSISIIAGVLGVELAKEPVVAIPSDEVNLVAECLAEADEVSIQDIVEELRQSGLNNAVNVSRVKGMLAEWGVKLCVS